MTMDKIYIDELLKYGEHINLECKKAERGIPKSIWETYSAFSNTNGGTHRLQAFNRGVA